MVGVEVEVCLGALIIVVSISAYALCASVHYCSTSLTYLHIDLIYLNNSVLVSGLPSSASWQDLKVIWSDLNSSLCYTKTTHT